ncbi:HEAT repeat domain-containing protein [Kitasatospora sp. NPDC004289]
MIENFEGLHAIDWPSLGHAYGSAEEVPLWLEQMASPDRDVREAAFSSFYSAVHHQGDVYRSTAASVPFLFALADDPAVPDRAAVVRLLVSIGGAALEKDPDGLYFDPSGQESTPYPDVVPQMTERSYAFVRYAEDADPHVRLAAVPALAMFLEDADRAFALLRQRLAAEAGTPERLSVIEAAAALAGRHPAALGVGVTSWLTALATDPALDAGLRLAALVRRAACSPAAIDADLVPTAVGLLRQTGAAPSDERKPAAQDTDRECACSRAEPAPVEGAPPQIAAVFAELDRRGRVHAPTTDVLTALHRILDSRVTERAALLTAQLTAPDAATRYDAVAMAADLIGTWRGDHTHLVALIADRLSADDPYTSAEAAQTLGRLPAALAESAREPLAALVEAQRTAHGPEVWDSPHPLLRRSHQEAVMALAGLADERALPSLRSALDREADLWRAVPALGHFPQASSELVPELSRRLAEADFSEDWYYSDACGPLAALRQLGDPAAVPALTAALVTAVRHEQWRGAAAVVNALADLGTGAAPALEVVRPLADAEDPDLRLAAVRARWEIEGNAGRVVPRLTALLGTTGFGKAAELLARIGGPAAAALPLLRAELAAGFAGTRVDAAAAIHAIGGPGEAEALVPVVLSAWEENDSTAVPVLRCLRGMGTAAAPALPRVRAELARVRRSGGFFASVERDEELLELCRAVVSEPA